MREKIIYLLENVSKGSYLSEMMNEKFLSDLSKEDENLLYYTVYGTVENRMLIDEWIKKYSTIGFYKIENRIIEILRFSIYQLVFMDSIPDYAILDEANKLAGQRASGFVNGILRSIQRNQKSLYENRVNEKPWIRYSINQSLYDLLKKEYSKNSFKKILKSFHDKDDFVIRINAHNSKDILTSLRKQGYFIEEIPYLKEGYIIENPKNIFTSKEFINGKITVQKGGSILAAKILAPRKGDLVLDLCAAPGGKTAYLSFLMDNTGLICANDIHSSKKERMVENFQRLHVDNVKLSFEDARILNKEWIGVFDRVLLDVPCSGLGRIKQYPEIKLFRTKEDILNLQNLQRQIIDQAIQYVKPGGLLVYSTCTITDEENKCQSDYLAKQLLPEKIKYFEKEENFIQTMPYSRGMGGFFISKFRKPVK